MKRLKENNRTNQKVNREISKSQDESHKNKIRKRILVSIPETNPDLSKLSAVEKRIYDEIVRFEDRGNSTTLEKRRQENFSELV